MRSGLAAGPGLRYDPAVRVTIEERQEILAVWTKHIDWSVHRIAQKCAQEPRTVIRVLEAEGIDASRRRDVVRQHKAARDEAIRREVRDIVDPTTPTRNRSMAAVGRRHGISREWVRRIVERR